MNYIVQLISSTEIMILTEREDYTRICSIVERALYAQSTDRECLQYHTRADDYSKFQNNIFFKGAV